MRLFVRLCRAECYKMRHTILPALHLCVPLVGSAAFLLYYWGRDWGWIVQLSGFAELTGLAFPFLVSVLVSRSVGLEEENHYQTFLGGSAGRIPSLLAKCVVLQLFGLTAVFIGIGSYTWGEWFLLGNREISGIVSLSVGLSLWMGSLVLYPIHLFLSMRFSKSISMGIGVAQSVLAGLLVTGLGDGIWQFVPGSWSIRLAAAAMRSAADSELALKAESIFRLSVWRELFEMVFLNHLGYICLLISIGIYAIIFLWFHLCGDSVAVASTGE